MWKAQLPARLLAMQAGCRAGAADSQPGRPGRRGKQVEPARRIQLAAWHDPLGRGKAALRMHGEWVYGHAWLARCAGARALLLALRPLELSHCARGDLGPRAPAVAHAQEQGRLPYREHGAYLSK